MDLTTYELESSIKLTLSPSFQPSNQRRAFIRHSQDYVLHLARLANSYAVSLSAPSNKLSVIDKSTLQTIHSWSGHTDAVTSIRSPSSFSVGSQAGRNILLSSGKDACVKAWDERTVSGHTLELVNTDRRAVLSFDMSSDGVTIATGSEMKSDDAVLAFWDIRKSSQPTHTNNYAHSDDITTLAFHPTSPNVLLSGSVDGLLTTTNSSEPDEDESNIQIGNWACSISAAGWTDAATDGKALASSRVWAHSDMQTVSLWNEELDMIHDYGDMRKPTLRDQWSSEYFIDALWLGEGSRLSGATGLGMWAGANNGDIALVVAEDASSWKVERILKGAHTDIVRCVMWDPEHSVLITGGEDGTLASWSISSPEGASETTGTSVHRANDESMDIDNSDELVETPKESRGSKRKKERLDDEDMNEPKGESTKKKKKRTGELGK